MVEILQEGSHCFDCLEPWTEQGQLFSPIPRSVCDNDPSFHYVSSVSLSPPLQSLRHLSAFLTSILLPRNLEKQLF
jgi:hypothetical protein